MASDEALRHEAKPRADQSIQYEVALEGVSDAVIMTDALNRILFMNAAAQAMTGWVSSDAIGKPLRQVFISADINADGTFDGALDDAQPPATAISAAPLIRAVLVDRRGVHIAIEYRTSMVRDSGGGFVGAVIVARDITRRRAAEMALLENEKSLLANADALFEEKERAHVTLNSIGDAVISSDFRGKVTYLNIVAEKMTGWTQAEASGLALDDVFRLVDSTTRDKIPCPTTKAIIEDHTVAVEAACVLIRRDGAELAVENSAAPIHDRNGGVIGAVMIAHDVTAARELSSKLARLALHDSLTDLPNRTLFRDRLAQAMMRAHGTGSSVALLYVDLDRFKEINDSLGHNVGDLLLQAVARRLLACVRGTDTVSRLGGDEFVLVLADVHRVADAAVCADKIVQGLSDLFRIGDFDLRVTASIGVAIFPDDATDADALIRCADLAMYQAKYMGRDTYRFFKPDMIPDSIAST
jgi:diguanylate cyclase (GGDEF)-like protein/PAS domain S-box-containing protein